MSHRLHRELICAFLVFLFCHHRKCDASPSLTSVGPWVPAPNSPHGLGVDPSALSILLEWARSKCVRRGGESLQVGVRVGPHVPSGPLNGLFKFKELISATQTIELLP